jgi:thiol-disulfide isomerase/thioredoxin
MRYALIPALLLPSAVFLAHAETPAPAKELVSQTAKQAATSGKNTLVSFKASWCSWCKRLDEAMEKPESKKAIEKHFEVLWLTVFERGDSKAMENPGSEALLSEWAGGAKTGLPFAVILGSDEKPIATSIRAVRPGGEPGNIGFPGDDEERDAFLAFLKAGTPNLTTEEEKAVRDALRAAMPEK